MIGTLTSIMGPMYAGKTTEIIKKILWVNHQNLPLMVIKPSIDNRYSKEKEIVTHTGHKFKCHYLNLGSLDEKVSFSDNLVLQDAENMNTIFLDEIQFFDPEILNIINKWIMSGINVVVSGLDQDSSGNPFYISAHLLAISDEIIKLTSNCDVCGQPATKTQKLIDTGNTVDVGSNGMYEARCLKHWTPKK
jgi:thymidine kinase